MLKADLSGVTALITGGSSGLGAHFARLLACSGASVLQNSTDRCSCLPPMRRAT
jgi:NAD(P)-dependent dehydrogenase (short-subunit alcohol dehydrogenase family)